MPRALPACSVIEAPPDTAPAGHRLRHHPVANRTPHAVPRTLVADAGNRPPAGDGELVSAALVCYVHTLAYFSPKKGCSRSPGAIRLLAVWSHGQQQRRYKSILVIDLIVIYPL